MNSSTLKINSNKRIADRLQRIANVLLINASFIDNIGLLNGKMGIAIFFFHYGRYSNNNVYTDYAGELIDEIYEEINTNTPTDFDNGLTGIAWGIEYLVENKFVDADTDVILADIDNFVYSNMLNSSLLLNNENVLFGYGLYFISRLRGHDNDIDKLMLNKKKQLTFLTEKCEQLLVHKAYSEFNIQQLSATTINSLLWFLLELQRLAILPSKVKKVLKHLPDNISYGQIGLNKHADLNILHDLSQRAIIQLTAKSLKEQYRIFAARVMKEITNYSNNEQTLLTYLQSKNIQELIYGSDIKCATLDRALFEKALEIIDDEEKWNITLKNLYKSNLGLSGLAGQGLLLFQAYKLNYFE